MIAKIQGEFLERRTGKTTEGREYDYAVLLSGTETVNISGYDPGAAVKRLDKVEVLCELRMTKEGRLFVNRIKA